MEHQIADRLTAVRQRMTEQQLAAFIQPRADEYLGEYVPTHNERLHWLSNFTGSAGAAVVFEDSAAIFIDGRYTVQVRQQVDGDLFEYQSLTELPLADYLCQQLPSGSKVGIDARQHTYAWYQKTKQALAEEGIELVCLAQNPIDQVWLDRPQPAKGSIRFLEQSSTGASSGHKRQQVGQLIAEKKADVAFIPALDSIAWLLNIRGNAVPCLPVVLGTALLYADGRMHFFTDLAQLPDNIQAHVGEGVTFHAEEAINLFVAELKGKKLLADPETAHAATQVLAEQAGATLVPAADPTLLLKACKNEAELAGMRACHIRDGVAVSQFLAWLDAEVAAKRFHDEGQLADKLATFRKLQPDYIEPSFDTISAAGANAAMCHYNHLNGTPAILPDNSIYLVDSGGQYLDGTTDVTRTVAIGTPTAEHQRMFTLVLKGHIALDCARFPRGTTGQQLDVLARQYLWQAGTDYDHGTGHGVGHFLSVHEGPQRISKHPFPVALDVGMVLSNEPGYYREGAEGFGIRIENLVEVQVCQEISNPERDTYCFKALTLIPIDTRLIDKSLMTAQEINWLNQYHQQVYQTLSPLISSDTQAWLEQATAAI